MRFWDSSAVVPLLVDQEASEAMARAVQKDPEVFAWWGTSVECGSAIARLERDGVLTEGEADVARSRLDALALAWHEVQPSEQVRKAAQRLLRVHSLRAMDALQAGAAMVLSEHDPTSLGVVCLDSRLADVLRREGFALDPATG